MLDGVCCLKLWIHCHLKSTNITWTRLSGKLSQFFIHILIIMFSSYVDPWVGLQTYSLSSTPDSAFGQRLKRGPPSTVFHAFALNWQDICSNFGCKMRTTISICALKPQTHWQKSALASRYPNISIWEQKVWKTNRQFVCINCPPCQSDLDI